jgi:hypothetical protein
MEGGMLLRQRPLSCNSGFLVHEIRTGSSHEFERKTSMSHRLHALSLSLSLSLSLGKRAYDEKDGRLSVCLVSACIKETQRHLSVTTNIEIYLYVCVHV